MRYRYTLIYRPYGMALPPGERTVVLQVPPDLGLTATLTLDLDPLALEVDRYHAIGNRILGGLTGGSRGKTLEEQIMEVRQERARFGAACFLAVTGHGDFDWAPSNKAQELEGVLIDLDGPGRAPLREELTPALKALMCTLFLATDELGQMVLVSDAGVFLPEDGPPIYQYNLLLSARTHVGRVLTAAVNSTILDIGSLLLADPQLERVSNLVADSLANDDDPLRSFLTSWAALEILINKVFPVYEEHFARQLAESHPNSGHQRYLKRVRDVMTERVTLADKFTVIAAALSPDTEERDSAAFMRLKKIRDHLAHGQVSISAPLPSTEPALLTKRLLVAHLRAMYSHDTSRA